MTLDPSRACGDFCSPVSGYDQVAEFPSIPPGQPDYPWRDITSQNEVAVGSAPCGPQYFTGLNLDQGSCPTINEQVLTSHQYWNQ